MMKFVVAAAVVGLAAARCPNDCSGHGTCGASDMCTCQRNWMAADCSERVCPFGLSFVDTPQGDLDGDSNVEKTMFHTFDGVAACGDTDDTTDFNNWCYEDANSWGVLAITRDDRKLSATGFDFGCFGSSTTGQAQSTFCEGVSKGDMITIEGTTTANGRNNDGWFIVEQTNTCLDQGMNPNCVKSNADKPSPYGVKTTLNTNYKQQASISTWIIVEDHRGEIPTSLGATTHRFHGDTGVETLQDESSASATITVRGHPVQWSNQLESEYYPHDAQEDEAHFYAECSNKGHCNRKTGECECLDGYEGVGCERTACPNSCSGHGVCEALADLVHGNDPYALWDGTNVPKTYGCVCDARFSGPDCSARVCPKGDDPLTTGQVDEVQQVELYFGRVATATAITTSSTDNSITFADADVPSFLVAGAGFVIGNLASTTAFGSTDAQTCIAESLSSSAGSTTVVVSGCTVDGDDDASTPSTPWLQQSGQGGTFSLYFTDEFGEVWRTSEINAREYYVRSDVEDCVFSYLDRSVTCESGAFPSAAAGFDDEDYITISGTHAGSRQYTDSANDGEFKVFDPKDSNSRTESVSTTAITFAEGTAFVDFDEQNDASSWASDNENVVTNSVTFTRSNGLKTALLNLPNDVIEDVSVSVLGADSDNADAGIVYRVTFTSNPGDLPEMVCDNSKVQGDVNSFDADSFPISLGEAAGDISFTAPDTITFSASDAKSGWLNTAAATLGSAVSAKAAFRDSDHILVTGSKHNDGIYEIQQHPDAVSNTRILVRQQIRTEASSSDDIVVYKQRCQVRSELERVGFYDGTNFLGAGSADGTTDADCSTLSVSTGTVGSGASAHTEYTIADSGSSCDLSKFDIGDQLTIECGSGCNNDGKTVTVTTQDPATGTLTVLPGGTGNDVHGAGRTDNSGDAEDTLVADASPTQMFVTRYGHGTRELIDCSGRGLCDGGSGVCACFKGYTGDDCSAQNALAM